MFCTRKPRNVRTALPQLFPSCSPGPLGGSLGCLTRRGGRSPVAGCPPQRPPHPLGHTTRGTAGFSGRRPFPGNPWTEERRLRLTSGGRTQSGQDEPHWECSHKHDGASSGAVRLSHVKPDPLRSCSFSPKDILKITKTVFVSEPPGVFSPVGLLSELRWRGVPAPLTSLQRSMCTPPRARSAGVQTGPPRGRRRPPGPGCRTPRQASSQRVSPLPQSAVRPASVPGGGRKFCAGHVYLHATSRVISG